MIEAKSNPVGEGEHYRRGALMGFTVAESFMLIAFALLLLLALWRFADDERNRAIGSLSPSQLATIERAAQNGSLDDLLALQLGDSERAALREGAIIVSKSRISALEDTARLVAEADVRRLAEAVASMPDDLRRRLTDLVKLDDYKDLFERLEAIKILDDGGAVFSALEKEKMLAALEVARQIDEGRAAAGVIEQEVAERIRARTGALVEKIGGEITETGDVVLPDALLFSSGEAQITASMSEFLNGFCRPWFEILYDAGPSLAGVQIEGHASSEWKGLGPSRAYLENLRLSQERARTVFSFCLQLVGDDKIGLWARERLSAVGYSSARKVVVGGQEDRARSRRVVFNIDADRSALFQRIDAAKENQQPKLPISLSEAVGKNANLIKGIVTKVRDGDTLVVGKQAVRLDGLHAPELSDVGGKEAAAALQRMILNRPVTCYLNGKRSHDRLIGICEGNGQDLAIAMVQAGLARDCPAFSKGRYAKIEPESVKTMQLPDYCLR